MSVPFIFSSPSSTSIALCFQFHTAPELRDVLVYRLEVSEVLRIPRYLAQGCRHPLEMPRKVVVNVDDTVKGRVADPLQPSGRLLGHGGDGSGPAGLGGGGR